MRSPLSTPLLAAALIPSLGVCPMAPAAAEPGVELAVSAGGYDVGDFEADTAEAGAELRLGPFLRGSLPDRLTLRPMAGLAGTSDGALWAYAGVRAEVAFDAPWLVCPSFGVSAFDEGDGKDLGGPVEFRSALEIAYRLGGGRRLGVTFHHLSNAGLYDDNPGSNSLLLTFSLPLGGR